jgi:hypothetical protein
LAKTELDGKTFRMNPKARLTAIIILLLSCVTGARAMPVLDFARMNLDDQATYVMLLVEGSAKMLKAHGQPDQARKAISFFKDSSKEGGVQQFATHLKAINALNTINSTNPNNRAPVYQVEDAMEQTLRDNGIIVPVSYLLTVNKDFVPSGPPRH